MRRKLIGWEILIILSLLFLALVSIEGNFNLYLSPQEMKRNFGLSKELYYVREGVTNEYALNFIVTVPAHINTLNFTWQVLGSNHLPYSYSLSIESSNLLAMDKPTLSIPRKGFIPTEPQTFQLMLTCTGDMNDEVEIKLAINVTSFTKVYKKENKTHAQVTSVTIRRRKICLEDPNLRINFMQNSVSTSPNSDLLVIPTNMTPSKNRNRKEEEKQKQAVKYINISSEILEDSHSPTLAEADGELSLRNFDLLFIILGFALGLVAFLITMASAVIVIFRTQKVAITNNMGIGSRGFLNKNSTNGDGSICTSSNNSGSSSSTSTTSEGSLRFIRSESVHHYSLVSPSTLRETETEYSSLAFNPSPTTMSINPSTFYSKVSTSKKTNNYYLTSMNTVADSNIYSEFVDQITTPRCKVRLQSVIMEGRFARIYSGTLLGKDGLEKAVLVKTVTDTSSAVQMTLLVRNGLSLVGMEHENVLSVVGVALEEKVSPFLIYPDHGFQNLKRFLQNCRSGFVDSRKIATLEIVHLALQIGSGLSFLHCQNVVHGDVATRNCVVDEKLRAKVTDGGLSKDLFPEDYNCLGDSEMKPVKWMSPELLLYKANPNPTSAPADKWSFGVFLWELATLAQQPYAEFDVNVRDLLTLLKMGYRLDQPINCKKELYACMTRCWALESDDRPNWTHLFDELSESQLEFDPLNNCKKVDRTNNKSQQTR